MRHLTISAVALAWAIAPLPVSAANLTIWVGSSELLSVPAACNATFPGFSANQPAPSSVFRVRLDPMNEPPTTLTMVFSQYGGMVSMRWVSGDDQMHGTGNLIGYGLFKDGTGNIGGNGFNGTYNFVVNPAAINANTNVVTINGTIGSYGGVAGCNVKFQGAYVRQRP